MPPLSVLYATDEAVAVRSPGDFFELCPDHQVVSAGVGSMAAASPWVLSCPTAAFAASGVLPGNVVFLDGTGDPEPFGPDGLLMAVDQCGPTTLTLRRIGASATGIGLAPAASDFPAVKFAIRTLGPQIEDASYDLNQRFGIDDAILGKTAAGLYDARELRQACVLTVLLRQYTAESRGKEGDWAAKIALARADLETTLDRLAVKWGQMGMGQPAVSRMGARVIR